MPSPITWRNVTAQNSGGGRLLESGAKLMSSGLDRLRGVVSDKIQDKTDRNTQAFLDQVNSYKTADGLAAGADDLAALRSSFGRYVDADAIRGAETNRGDAIQDRLNKERNQLVADQNFEDAQMDRDAAAQVAEFQDVNRRRGEGSEEEARTLLDKLQSNVSPALFNRLSNDFTTTSESDRQLDLRDVELDSAKEADAVFNHIIENSNGDYNQIRRDLDAATSDPISRILPKDAQRIKAQLPDSFAASFGLGPDANRTLRSRTVTEEAKHAALVKKADRQLETARRENKRNENFAIFDEKATQDGDLIQAAHALNYDNIDGFIEGATSPAELFQNKSTASDIRRAEGKLRRTLSDDGVVMDQIDHRAIKKVLLMAIEKQGPAGGGFFDNNDLDVAKLYTHAYELWQDYKVDRKAGDALTLAEQRYDAQIAASEESMNSTLSDLSKRLQADAKARGLQKR